MTRKQNWWRAAGVSLLCIILGSLTGPLPTRAAPESQRPGPKWPVITAENAAYVTFRGAYPHSGTLINFAFSPDDRLVAVLDGTPRVDVLEVLTGKLAFTLKGHEKPVQSVQFSPDGKLIATTSEDQTVNLWDGTTGKEVRTWKLDEVSDALAFSPDGVLLATNGGQAGVHLWEVERGSLSGTLEGAIDADAHLQFHAGTLLSVYTAASLTQWDWKAKQKHEIVLPKVTRLSAISSDGTRTLAAANTGCEQPGIAVFDNSQTADPHVLVDCPTSDTAAGFNKDGSLMAITHFENADAQAKGLAQICLFSTKEAFPCLAPDDGPQKLGKVAFSQGGRILAAILNDGSLGIWRFAYPAD